MVRKLDTIQTKQKLNEVYAVDEVGPGGANHSYLILKNGSEVPISSEDGDKISYDEENYIEWIRLQKGPRKEEDSQHGVIDTDLLEIARDRLKAFQSGPYACNANQIALEHIEIALKALNQRVEDRIARNVLGKNEK